MIYIISIYLFYIGFVVYAGCQVAIYNRKWLVIIPCVPIILLAGLIDVLFNQVFGRLMFWEMKFTFTFSERLDLHFHDSDWRGRVAHSIGDAIDQILPNHIK